MVLSNIPNQLNNYLLVEWTTIPRGSASVNFKTTDRALPSRLAFSIVSKPVSVQYMWPRSTSIDNPSATT